MKKTDVYVAVDTPKKANKLKKVLDMFGENVYSLHLKYCAMGYLYKDEWHSGSTPPKNKTEVSIKELRNILAKEHLKDGDVVLTKNSNDKIIAVVNKTCNSNVALFEAKIWIRLHDGFKWDNKGCFDDFIRYATEEEKALLEPKKELEVGKWYKGTCDFESLIFITEIENTGSYNNIHGYGFKWGQWNDLSHLLSNTDHEKSLVEATPKKLEQALIEEAKNRYKIGDFIKCLDGIESEVKGTAFVFYNNCLFLNGESFGNRGWLNTYGLIFKDGQWATVIEQDNFTDSDIAIVERLHDALLENHGYSLESKLLMDARMLASKIKSNIK